MIEIKKWQCIGSGFTLGMVENDKIVRIKRNDLYVETEGGKVTVGCRGCGKRNTLEDIPRENTKSYQKGGDTQ